MFRQRFLPTQPHRSLSIVLLAVSALVMTACGSGNSTDDASVQPTDAPPASESTGEPLSEEEALAELYAAAVAEGDLVWQMSAPFQEPLLEAFQAAYPDLKVSPYLRSGPESAPILVSEAQAGRVSTDVAMLSIDDLIPLIERDLLGANDFEALGIPSSEVSMDGGLIILYENSAGIAFNTDSVPESDVPTEWEDLLDPRWQGFKMATEAEPKSFAIPYFRLFTFEGVGV